MTEFAHISPTHYLDVFASGRPFHLTLAHLVEEDAQYANWYANIPRDPNTVVVMDNGGFEMYKQGKPMYEQDKLIDMGLAVGANYIVMSDYPGEAAVKTVDAAKDLAPKFKEFGFGTFFVPQAEIGNINGVLAAFEWAAQAEEVDYIGVSILTAPNMFGVEKGNKLQRFLSRWKLMHILLERGILDMIVENEKKLHFLGMVDGPNEIDIVADFLEYIDTWDSSAAVWAGLNGIEFDNSPTGLINGKYEVEVDFDHNTADYKQIAVALNNCRYIDKKLEWS